MDTLSLSSSAHAVTVGVQWAWSAGWNTEQTRMAAASVASACNLLVIAADWDFPDFSGEVTSSNQKDNINSENLFLFPGSPV